MTLRGDERGVSEVLGAVLVFGLVIALLVLIQTMAVPAANEKVEFSHNQQVQNDFLGFQQAADTAATQAASQTTNIKAGVDYPNRFLLLNPPAASGSLRTQSSYFSIDNARAVESETSDFWQGGTKNYSTEELVYEPNYNLYDNAPTTRLGHGIAYNSHPNGNTTLLGTGDVVNGNKISLLALDGNLSTTSASTVALEADPVDAPRQRVSVENAGANPIRLHLRTQMTNETWSKLLEDETIANGGHVKSWKLNNGVITITLEKDVVYNLQMAKVGVGSGAVDDGPAYLTKAGTPQFAESGGNELAVQARDKYNTPESGVNVTFELESSPGDGVFVDEQGNSQGHIYTVTTNEDGIAKARFDPSSNLSVTIKASYGSDANETVYYNNIAVVSGGGGGTGGDLKDINSRTAPLYVTRSSISGSVLNVTFKNAASQDWTMSEGRIPVVLNANKHDYVTNANLTRVNPDPDEVIKPAMYVGANFTSFDRNQRIADGGTVTMTFDFDKDLESTSGAAANSLVIFSVYISNDFGDSRYQTFFLADGFNPPSGGGGGGGGGGNNPPNVDLTVSDTSNRGHGAKYDLSWSASDPDNNLDASSVTVTVLHNGSQVATYTQGASGSATYDPSTKSTYNDQYTFRIEASDTDSHTTCKEATDDADGTSPSSSDFMTC